MTCSHMLMIYVAIAYNNMVAITGNGKCRVCDPQSQGPLVMDSIFHMIRCLHHIDMMSPDTRTVKTEATAQSCYTQRQMILQHFITVGYKCLPGSRSLLFRLWLELSLSHILSGRKTHEPKIRFASGSRARKVVWPNVCVLCHTVSHSLCWCLSLSPRTVSKAKHDIRSACVISALLKSLPLWVSASTGKRETGSLAGPPPQQQHALLLFWAAG